MGPQNALSLLRAGLELQRLTGRPLTVGYADWRPGDQRVFVCDIGKARRELGWAPKVSALAGIERLYRWIDGNKGLFGWVV